MPRRNIKYKIKKGLSIFSGLILTLIVLFAGFAFLFSAKSTVDDSLKVDGLVRYRESGKYFKFKMEEWQDTLYIYRASRSYSDLNLNIAEGDAVTVYLPFSMRHAFDEPIQIEKNGEIIYGMDEYQNKNVFVSVFCLIMGSVMLFLLIRYWRKE